MRSAKRSTERECKWRDNEPMKIRAYKIRLYPNAEQEQSLSQYFGAARFVWNVGLEMMSRAWSEREDRLTYVDVSKQFTALKRTPEFDWLKAISSDVIIQKLRDLDRAYSNFFAKRAKYPRFRNRHRKQSIRFQFDRRNTGKVAGWVKGEIVLPKLGVVKWRDGSDLPKTMPKMITVSRDPDGRYFASFAVEYEPARLAGTKALGIDVGIASLATCSNGTRIENPRHLDELDARLRFHQRRLSFCQKGSKRYEKRRKRVAKLHAKIRDSRQDSLQKATTRIIRESQAGVIAVENLNIKGMGKNHRLARSIHDASMSEFLRILEYKADWAGIEWVKVDRWYPSSKTCSGCGHKVDEMDLSVREWTCPKCGTSHNRDLNAAINIAREGVRILAGSQDSGQSPESAWIPGTGPGQFDRLGKGTEARIVLIGEFQLVKRFALRECE